MPDPTVQDLIRQEAASAKLDPALPLAVAEQESQFNPYAHNKESGAHGVFQFIPSTAKARGLDPTNVRDNIHHGVTYLRELMDQHQGNIDNVLRAYGGVRNDTSYVPSVRARLSKYQTGDTPPPAAPSAGGPPAAAGQVASAQPSVPTTPANTPPPEKGWGQWAWDTAKDVASGLDPRTPAGRRNLAGGAAAAGAAYLAPEVALPVWAARALGIGIPILGAAAGGGAEQTVEDIAHGKAPSLQSATGAAVEQGTTEAMGQVVAWPIKAVWRRVAASGLTQKITQGLRDAVGAAETRVRGLAPSVSPAQAGRMAEDVAQGPARTVREQLGEDVNAAAATGPRVDPAGITSKLDDVEMQLNPGASQQYGMPSPTYAAAGPGRSFTQPQTQKLAAVSVMPAPTDHPLPGVLSRAREIIQAEASNSADGKVSFQTVHEVKRMLDDAINFKSPVRSQVQGATQGLRGAVREALTGHAPYDQATAAYAPVAKLFTEGSYPKLHKEILSNPEGLVNTMSWQKPTSVRLMKELTVDTAAQAGPGGAQQGEAAWDAIRAAWTHKNLSSKGPEAMLKQMRAMEGSASGQEFLQTMYQGDPQGQMVWKNLKQLGEAWEHAVTKEGAFKEADLPRHASSSALRDIGFLFAPGHSVYKFGAMSRLLHGPKVGELLQWTAYSPARTQFFIKHVLTGATPGMALADFARAYFGSEEGEGPPLPGTRALITPPAQAANTPPPSR